MSDKHTINMTRDELVAEVKRLRAELHSVHAHLQHYRNMLAAERERWARLAEAIGLHHGRDPATAQVIAAAIRKGEP